MMRRQDVAVSNVRAGRDVKFYFFQLPERLMRALAVTGTSLVAAGLVVAFYLQSPPTLRVAYKDAGHDTVQAYMDLEGHPDRRESDDLCPHRTVSAPQVLTEAPDASAPDPRGVWNSWKAVHAAALSEEKSEQRFFFMQLVNCSDDQFELSARFDDKSHFLRRMRSGENLLVPLRLSGPHRGLSHTQDRHVVSMQIQTDSFPTGRTFNITIPNPGLLATTTDTHGAISAYPEYAADEKKGQAD